jgi:hypothetical protein
MGASTSYNPMGLQACYRDSLKRGDADIFYAVWKLQIEITNILTMIVMLFKVHWTATRKAYERRIYTCSTDVNTYLTFKFWR